MVDSERLAYLQALGLEQWKPRLQAPPIDVPAPVPAPVATQQAATAPHETASASLNTPTSNPTPREPLGAVVQAVEAPARDQLQSPQVAELLRQAGIHWQQPATRESSLAVLGLDAVGSVLGPSRFETEWPVLQKMLAAIGQDLAHSAVGQLYWGGQTDLLPLRYALILVDSGEDRGALIQPWIGKTVAFAETVAVIAPHPRLFSQGAELKRAAWTNMQLLQQQWR